MPLDQLSTHLQHLLSEVLLVVTERTLEEVGACVLRCLLHTLPVEPATAAGSPEKLPTFPVIQGHRAAAALLPHLHLHAGLLLVVEGRLQRLVNRAEGFKLSVKLLEAAVLQPAWQVVTLPGIKFGILWFEMSILLKMYSICS